MNRLYAAILLFSFIIGVFQPVIPMVEHYFNEGDIIKLIFFQKTPDDLLCEGVKCPVDLISNCNCEKNCSDNNSQKLLDLEYYPTPVEIKSPNVPVILTLLSELYNTLNEELTLRFTAVNSPPPKLA